MKTTRLSLSGKASAVALILAEQFLDKYISTTRREKRAANETVLKSSALICFEDERRECHARFRIILVSSC
jgi:hypothetical protein